MTVVPRGVDLLQRLPHAAADLDVDAGGGLVEDQQPRPGDHRAGDHQPPLHAARQRARHHVRLLPQLRGAQLGLGALGGLGARHAVEARVVHADVEGLLEHVEVDFLRHQADLPHRRRCAASTRSMPQTRTSPRWR
jgi:hypothetical protein